MPRETLQAAEYREGCSVQGLSTGRAPPPPSPPAASEPRQLPPRLRTPTEPLPEIHPRGTVSQLIPCGGLTTTHPGQAQVTDVQGFNPQMSPVNHSPVSSQSLTTRRRRRAPVEPHVSGRPHTLAAPNPLLQTRSPNAPHPAPSLPAAPRSPPTWMGTAAPQGRSPGLPSPGSGAVRARARVAEGRGGHGGRPRPQPPGPVAASQSLAP